MKLNLRSIALCTTLSLLAGCTASYKHTLEFNPHEPIRVAVLPFAEVNSKGEIVDNDANYLIDKVGIVSAQLDDTPSKLTRKFVRSELKKTAIDVIPPAFVDSKLVHNGYALPGSSVKEGAIDKFPLDLKRVFSASTKDLCANLLSCDALLYGRITKWDRSYYGIQSSSTVGLELKLVSRDGTVLFEAKAEDSDSRGISKGPTGFSDLVIEPIKGLDNQIIIDLSRSVVSKMLSPLLMSTKPNRPDSPPPAIYAAGHDASDGIINHNEHLTVIMYGSPAGKASFSILKSIENVPMSEIGEGHYIGEFYPLANDSFQEREVEVYLRDKVGRTSSQKIGAGAISLRAAS